MATFSPTTSPRWTHIHLVPVVVIPHECLVALQGQGLVDTFPHASVTCKDNQGAQRPASVSAFRAQARWLDLVVNHTPKTDFAVAP